ncbi:hypothetical protein RHSIM_Rhsim03G0269600 [Rhododendron simsii]|uniref:Uncharacterized protein n=1 Tax=Rhododendron simsii TaxID=118357 RepID=A0A834H7H5_RHOSS|nr:hypothetical protein RHSIM_Rhsim03G0269600 [Rhododendron simsii]
MYDDIALDDLNARKGIIIHHPYGQDAYKGVPKDYTGRHVTKENFLAVLRGERKDVKGGSGKVLASKAYDRVFLYNSSHGELGGFHDA